MFVHPLYHSSTGDIRESGILRQSAGLVVRLEQIGWCVLVSKTVRHRVPRGRSSISSGRIFRWILIPSIGGAFAIGAVWAVAGILAANTSVASVTNGLSPSMPAQRYIVSVDRSKVRFAAVDASVGSLAAYGQRIVRTRAPLNSDAPAATVAGNGKSDRHRPENVDRSNAAPASNAALEERFDRVVKQAALSPEKLAAVFKSAGMAVADTKDSRVIDLRGPAPERFAPWPSENNGVPGLALAYADPSAEVRAGALAALSAVAPTDDGGLPLGEPELDAEDDAALPDYENTPDSTPLPLRRPRVESTVKPAPRAERPGRPEVTKLARPEVTKLDRPEVTKLDRSEVKKLAYARPNVPRGDRSGGGLSRTFRNLFSAPRARGGVAVYDISAAKVYMPDGSVLEAHSGIGKMADNPRYTHVRMNGPTPPHTYNLEMREKRFHGVEAIRMLPVDGRNKHGRDGFLTHSYLLRSGRAESHGCVAFKDYQRFLTAFKKGKVRQLVVVPGGGKAAVHVASNGRNA
jgi:hypothetical protein